jgi:hypothetical protein
LKWQISIGFFEDVLMLSGIPNQPGNFRSMGPGHLPEAVIFQLVCGFFLRFI